MQTETIPQPTMSRILFACGGTGGHVYPAIAIADAVREIQPGAVIAFAGTREKMEWEAVPKAGYEIHAITVSGFHRGDLKRNLTFPFKTAKGLAESLALVGGFDADVVVGTGGYVTGPVGLAARLRGRPLVIQEQNAFAGVTNRLLGRIAEEIHVAFPEAQLQLPREKCTLSGNPTRDVLQKATEEGAQAKAREALGIAPDARVLFLFGGSLGSAALNAALADAAPSLLEDEKLVILWQTGKLYHERYAARIGEDLPETDRLRPMAYVDRMEQMYAAADLVVARAGAISCSELLVVGKPSILVPSPNVAEDHQTKNAQSLVNAGAADLVPEAQLPGLFAASIEKLLADPERRAKMSKAARSAARPEAADTIARSVLALAAPRAATR
jgi:UDP-N-acetylglucosamine--N-acetylmuramyl-(pentapeptide) pyrophosphoryl-undecaprenol N-acetylglucosamine transferase